MRLVPAYRPRPSALHAARPSAAIAFCSALALVPLVYEHPLVLAACLIAVVGAGIAARVGDEMAAAARLAVPLALLVTLINPLVYHEGNTLLVRGPVVLGQRFDVTLEALAFGAVAGLRVLVLMMVFGLFSACVDPDAVLRLFRRFSYRSALTAAIATRLIPVLARDATRMGDAARCRAVPARRAAVARAALSGALDRSVDVAAALEVRGYAHARPTRSARPPLSRHDLRVGAAALAMALGATGAALAEAGSFDPYPSLSAPVGPVETALAALLVVAAVAPFAGGAARLGVARA